MKNLKITLIILILLTFISATISSIDIKYATNIILILAILKFLAIVFFFMEIKKAHLFWRVSIIIFLVIFTSTILIIS